MGAGPSTTNPEAAALQQVYATRAAMVNQSPLQRQREAAAAAKAQQQLARPKPPPGPVNTRFPQRDIPEEFRPTAAVVGAGLAGMHCAWELSRLGFKVTVYDQFRYPGEGATKYDPGLVGRDPSLFTPVVWRVSALREYIKSLFPNPFGTSLIVRQDTPLGAVFRESWRTFARGRRNVRTDEQKIVSVASEVAGETADIVAALIEAEPNRFGACVVSQGEISSPSSSSSADSSSSSSSRWRCIDSSRWCRELQTVLQEQYDVKFKFRHVVTRLQWRVNLLNEFATSVITTDLESRDSRAEPHDMIVIAAGSMSILQRSVGANEGYPLPLLSVAGYGLDLPVSMAKKLLKEQAIEHLMPYHLSEKLFLRVMPTPPSAPPPSDSEGSSSTSASSAAASSSSLDVNDALAKKLLQGRQQQQDSVEPRVRVSGLISLLGDDVRRNFCEPSMCLAQLQSRVRASTGIDDLDKLTYVQVDNPESGINGFRYARGITSDGLPIVSRAGNAKNVFLCCGFGDDAALLAPGSAHWLSEIIMKQRCNSINLPPPPPERQIVTQAEYEGMELARSVDKLHRDEPSHPEPHEQKPNPLALDRFYKFEHWMQAKEIVEWQRRWYRGEKWLEDSGQPLITKAWEDFKESGLGKILLWRWEKKEEDS